MSILIENVPKIVVLALIEETNAPWGRNTVLNYRSACNLAKMATDGYHSFSFKASTVIDEIPDMLEHWGEKGFEIETIGQYGGVKFSFID